MHSLEQLETKQIGFRMPTYLVEEIDELTKGFDINRSTFIVEAIRKELKEQKEARFYAGLGEAMVEAKMMMDGKIPKTSLKDLIAELKDENQ
jgi:metal-responsive CopG/Arc/MetJ family transcriptional regulator